MRAEFALCVCCMRVPAFSCLVYLVNCTTLVISFDLTSFGRLLIVLSVGSFDIPLAFGVDVFECCV